MGKEQSKLSGGQELSLAGQGLAELPQDRLAAAAASLASLNVSRNELASLKGLAGLALLRQLDASHNLLESASMAGLVQLQVLDLSFNRLAALPADLSFLRRLRELNLSHNTISSLVAEIGLLDSLVFLDLSHNQLEELPEEFGQLAALEALYLTDNRLTAPKCRMGALCSLKMVDLSQNRLEALPDVTFLASITKLYLNNNRISSLSKDIRLLPKLRELSLRGNRLSSLPEEVCSMPQLSLLDLAENEFAVPAVFGQGDAQLIVAYLQADPAEQRRMAAEAKRAAPPAVGRAGAALGGAIRISADEAGVSQKPRRDFVVPYTKRLYQVKGTAEVVAMRVAAASKSLNDGDSFVFDIGKKVFVWHGPEANPRERAKAEALAHQLCTEELGGPEVVVLDAGLFEDSPLLPEGLDFWDQLGGKARVDAATEGGEDSEAAAAQAARTVLYKVVEDDESGRVEVVEAAAGGAIGKDLLNSSHCFVLDCWGEVFVWAGVESTTNEKSYALLKAEELAGAGRPSSAKAQWIVDGNELVMFREQFYDWRSRQWETAAAKMKATKAVQVEDAEAYDKVLKKQIRAEEKRLSKGLSHAQMKQALGKERTGVASKLKKGSSMIIPSKKEKKEKKKEAKEAKKGKKRQQEKAKAEESATSPEKESLPPAKASDKKEKAQKDLPKETLKKETVHSAAASLDKKEKQGELSKKSTTAAPRQGKVKIPAAFAGAASEGEPPAPKETAKDKVAKEIAAEKERVAKERAAREKAEKERLEREKDSRGKAEAEQSAKEKAAREKAEKEERERAAKAEKEERERAAKAEKEEQDRAAKAEKEAAKAAAKAEKERKKAEELEAKKAAAEAKKAKKEEKKQGKKANAPEKEEAKEEAKKEAAKEEAKKEAVGPLVRKKVAIPAAFAEKKDETAVPEPKRPAVAKKEPKKTELKREEPKKVVANMDVTAEKKAETDDKVEKKVEKKVEEKKAEKVGEKTMEKEEKKSGGSRLQRLKDPLAGPKKRTASASRNPLRARAARGSKQQTGASQTDVGTRAAAAGAYGMLWALGADDGLFQKRRLKSTTDAGDRRGKGPHLYHLKGRRRVVVREVELTVASLNSGDVFVLDTGKQVVYQWNGKEANRIEKGSALDFAKKIKDKEHQGNARIEVVEEKKSSSATEFWELLGKGKIAPAKDAGDDEEREKALRRCVRLFRAELHEGSVTLTPCGEPPYPKEVLETEGCFVLDCMAEIFPWTGRKAPLPLRNATVKKAKEMAAERPFWVADVCRQLEGGETTIFKERFSNWSSGLPISVAQAPVGLNTSKGKLSGEVDVTKLHTRAPPPKQVHIDDAKGDVRVWRIEEFEKVPVLPEQHGNFWSGESNIVLYKYIWKNKDCFLIYYFQGRDSSINEKGTSAMLTIELDKEVSGMAKEVRVVQFKEPKHFCDIFAGRLVVHRGKVSSWSKRPGPFLYDVRSKSAGPVAVECECTAWSLNSNHTFVLRQGTRFFLWFGRQSVQEEREFARANPLLQTADATLTEVEEGKEDASFWAALGGEQKYPQHRLGQRLEARLFHCSVATGTFDITEVVDFCQDDLSTHDVFLLDAGSQLFVWFGRRSNDRERRWAMEATQRYLETLPTPRTSAVAYAVAESEEPLSFTTHFHAWDGPQTPVADEELTQVGELLSAYSAKYSYKDLSTGNFPQALDTANLEHFLYDEEFEEVFKMDRAALAALPAWKRTKLKKELLLF